MADYGSRRLRVACLQLGHLDGESKPERLDRVAALVDDFAARTDLVVLPELWLTGYFSFDRYAAEAEPLDGNSVAVMRDVAARHRIHLMAGTFVERHEDGLSNSAVLLNPDGSLALAYRKIHLFGYESKEAQLLVPGDDLPIAKTEIGVIGTSTCYDLRFPELYRVLVDRGAELFVIPAAWPRARMEHWRVLLQARAIEDQVFVVACNGAGNQGGVELAGHSMVIGPWGAIVAEAGDDATVLRAELDLDEVARVRAEFPALQHRRL